MTKQVKTGGVLENSSQATEIPIEIASLCLRDPSKERCGDSCRQALLTDENLAVLCIADGVSQAACDWKASSTVCDVFMSEISKKNALGIAKRMESAVRVANEELTEQNIDNPRMLTTLVAMVWEWQKDEIHYVSVGDSRLYTVSNTELKLLTVDEALSVIMRGRDGKPLVSSGAVAVGRGVTNVLGLPEACFNVESISSKDVTAVILATDGYFGSGAFNPEDVVTIIGQTDLQKALDVRKMFYKAAQQDDCTVAIARKNDFGKNTSDNITDLLSQSKHFRDAGLPAFVVAKELIKRIEHAIACHDVEKCMSSLKYAKDMEIDLGAVALKKFLDLLSVPVHFDRKVFDTVLEAMRSSKN